MKTLTTIAAALLMIVSLNSFAVDKKEVYNTELEYTVKKAVNALTQGDAEGLDELFAPSFTYRFVRGTEIKTYGKKEVLKAIQETGNIRHNCSVAYQIMETEPDQRILLISMKYEDFTKLTRLTLKNSAKGWKVTRMASWFD